MSKNLITETLDFMEARGYTKNDVQWIGGNHFVVPPENFWNAEDQEYDSGYGWQEVAADLTIMFKDGTWMERAEYDGSEWWVYRHPPVMPLEIYPLSNFILEGHELTLVDIANRKCK